MPSLFRFRRNRTEAVGRSIGRNVTQELQPRIPGQSNSTDDRRHLAHHALPKVTREPSTQVRHPDKPPNETVSTHVSIESVLGAEMRTDQEAGTAPARQNSS